MLTRRAFLGTAAAAPLPAAPKRPNVIVIVGDDLGWGELGCQGFAKDIPTPNIDALARGGVRFTSGYVSCPVCSPTRAGLMTGRYQQRFGHEFNPGPEEQSPANFGLPLDQTTFADRMKKAGYRTGMVGKWHLGYRPEYHPLRRGFEEYFGFLGGADTYFHNDRRRTQPILRGTEVIEEREYLTDAFAREAVAFIERRKQDPFFLYLTFNAVHAPLEGEEKYLSRFPNLTGNRKTFASMLSGLDAGVGAVMKKLRDAKLERDTLVIFISDNGGPTPQTTSQNGPLRATKGQVYEGGIRVPLMMQWPGGLPAGKVYDAPAIALDLMPTSLGEDVPGIDGVNLRPYLTGAKKGVPHEKLFWRFGPQRAARLGDWKMTWLANAEAELYNLARDIGEQNNLAAAEPQRLAGLKAAWEKWNGELKEPVWRPVNRQGAAKKAGKRAAKK